MRLALYSDLHLEMITHLKGKLAWEPPILDVDVVILAGDIGTHTRGLEWATKAFKHAPEILYVAGNHEYYDAQLGLLAEFQKPTWEQFGVHFLERQCFELPGVRFLGCTLWSGFDLHGADNAEVSMDVARRSINDYWVIYVQQGKRLEPRDTLKLHRTAVRWLDSELAKPFDGKTVVVTHFAPHRRCIAPEHEGSDVSPYFVTDLAWLMEKHRIDLWCYGHTHTNTDFIAENGCRVVSNQLGYPRERSPNFRPDLIIEV
jgi:predicted phosphodiesterase